MDDRLYLSLGQTDPPFLIPMKKTIDLTHLIPPVVVHLKKVLRGVPKSLWDLEMFHFENYNEIKLYAQKMRRLKTREKDRNEIMKIQRRLGLSIEPNTSYRRFQMFLTLKNKRLEKEYGKETKEEGPDRRL